MDTYPSSLSGLRSRDQRGSRARCLILTSGSAKEVAARLSAISDGFAVVDANRHHWMPRGISDPREAKLGDASDLLSQHVREMLSSWWLEVRAGANTPNWDIASTASINGTEGLLLVEAKAHSRELSDAGKSTIQVDSLTESTVDLSVESNHAKNDEKIAAGCHEATTALNKLLHGWNLSSQTHYQLCNRFAWTWKLASLGIPVVLVYLGFLNAAEMEDQGRPFSSNGDWQALMRAHSSGIVPNDAWASPLLVDGVPVRALVRSVALSLP
jgi:hypothetical protein